MSNNNHPYVGPALRVGLPPWSVLLFLAFVFFLCQHNLFFTETFTTFNASKDEVLAALDEGSLSRRIALLPLALFGLASLIRHRRDRLRVNGLLGRIILFYAGWAMSSLLWAEDAPLTFRRLLVFAALCLAGAAIALRFSLRDIILGTFFTTGLYLIIGVCSEIALGTFRPFTSEYRFAGTLHPNAQGINCALLVLSGLAAADVDKRRRVLFRVCALLGFGFLILSGSRTAFAADLLAVAAYLISVHSWRSKLIVAFGLAMALWIAIVIGGGALRPDFESAVMLGRNDSKTESFNGRTGIWDAVGSYIGRRPILGYGYEGFWNQRHIADVTDISATPDFGVEESHCAYLECLLSLGIVGLTAYVFAFLGGIARSLALYRASHAPAYAFAGAYLIFCLANGWLESTIVLSIQVTFLTIVVLTELGFRQTRYLASPEPLMN